MKQAEILALVLTGDPRVQIPEAVELDAFPGIRVWADALQIDGIRVGVSARTAQTIALAYGLSLTTAALEDAIWLAASPVARLPPHPFNPAQFRIDADTTVEAHSRAIDKMVAERRLSPGTLLAGVGKAWVLDAIVMNRPKRAANYGWHSRQAPYNPVTAGVPKVWQPLATAHNLDHHDYSQTLRLVELDEGVHLPTHHRDPAGKVLPCPMLQYPVDAPLPDLPG